MKSYTLFLIPQLQVTLVTTGVVIIVVTIAEDIATGGIGIWNDLYSAMATYRLLAIAAAL
jgi:hypothetical protein